ncbi:winged helix-turn-helix domain-containing protein [Prauserella endophytica]|uniref:HTH gntR-type domain-containing protein n=2 Tax=Prauserella TaxID=142577 RepID=A0A318LFF6_9PSEU|nr:hypothetical protein BA062_36785 [Prauserella flavalba]PXY18622.1 hypothetical protein BAY59_33640 [Prauserella coralliicola]TKG63552.1 winged helix-turn-helix transcriptional regulator [Prauserella endophytica]
MCALVWEDRSSRIDHESLEQHLWEQVADDLRTMIGSRKLPPGAKLPNERELAELYAVSRPTTRRAVFELRKEGLLIVVTGKGTFVRR